MNTLSVGLQKIVDDYKNDLQRFIAENNLDAELSRDIEERIFEKISTLENPTRKDILKILSEIGTPEEIFSEEVALENNEKPKNFFEKFQEKTNKIIFLGTFFELAKKTSISANIFRILFFAMIIFGFMSWDGFLFVFPIFAYFIGFLLFRTRFFWFLFSLGLGAFFTMLLVPSVILFGMYLSDFHIENIYPFMGISVLFPIGMVLGIFSLVLFILYFFRYAFTKKFFGIGFLVTAIVSFVVAISMGIATVIDMASNLIREEETTEIIYTPRDADRIFNPFELSSGSDMSYQNYVNNIFDFPLWRSYSYSARIDVSGDENFKIFVNKTFAGLKGGKDAFILESVAENEYSTPKLKVKKNLEKSPLGVTIFDVEKVFIPVWKKFYIEHSQQLENRSEVIFENMEAYSREQQEKIITTCNEFVFDENKKPRCLLDEVDIKLVLDFYFPKPLSDDEKNEMASYFIRNYGVEKIVDNVSTTRDLLEKYNFCYRTGCEYREFIIAMPKNNFKTIYIFRKNDEEFVKNKNNFYFESYNDTRTTREALQNFFEGTYRWQKFE